MAVPNLWRTKKQRYNLQGEICVHCSSAVFPPREVCPYCGEVMAAISTTPDGEQIVALGLAQLTSQFAPAGAAGDD